jgi:signal transduction histidine kinase
LYGPQELVYKFELFLAGAAVVLDTALMLIVLERINRPFVALWLKLLFLGTIAFHVGYFGRVMIWNVVPSRLILLDHLLMCMIVIGLLLLPSAMLHAALRMYHTGLDAKPKFRFAYGLLYLPLLFAPFLFASILSRGDRLFLDSIAWFTPAYISWLLLSNCVAIGFFLTFARKANVPQPFLTRLVGALVLVCVGAVAYTYLSRDAQWEPTLRLAVCLSPLIPEGVFIWYTLKHRVLPLVMDRTLLYAVSMILGLLLHQLIISPIAVLATERSQIDLSILEAILVIGILLLTPPLRTRVREALRYLFSTNVFHVRDATRLLSVRLSQQANLEPNDLLQWFVDELAEKLDLDMAVIVIDSEIETSSNSQFFASNKLLPDGAQKPGETAKVEDWLCVSRAVQMRDRLDRGMITPQSNDFRNDKDSMDNALKAMERQGILLAFRLSFPTVHGAVLLGDRKRNDRLADEQMISIALLCDQLAATLGNKNESIRRFQVERRMMQNEKLSTLGLIAGSLAHELRNPLSSIRTIASLTLEELGPKHRNGQDLAIIVAEIDKLSQTTTRLLDSARPADVESLAVSPDLVIGKLLTLLNPLAKQLHVEVRQQLNCPDVLVLASDASISEIFFNLIKNAIEAATGRPEAWVQIVSEKLQPNLLRVLVSDNGPGIEDSLLGNLFEPFVTGKLAGTGLGLFVVSDRVKEMGGSIYCQRSKEVHATEFYVSLPICGSR